MSPSTNVLWIVADELRADALGCYGGDVHDTPHLDRLAASGTLFRRAIVNGPECVPSRASFMTGKYCKTVEVFNNQMGLELTSDRRAEALRIVDAMGAEAWQARIAATSSMIAKRFAAYSNPIAPGILAATAPFAALQGVVAQQGLYDDGPRHRMVQEIMGDAGYRTRNAGKIHTNAPRTGWQEVFQHPDEDLHSPFGVLNAEASLDPERTVLLPSSNVELVGGGVWPLPEERNPDARRTEDIVQFLAEDHADRPFFARLSLIWPHTPVLPPQPWDEHFDPDLFPLSEGPTDDELAGKSAYEALWRKRAWNKTLSRTELKRAWADYWGLSSYVDELVGRVLTALAASPHADNTLVIFSADHGTLLGEHGLWQKQQFYDPILCSPLIMALPGRVPHGQTIDEQVQLIDVMPTILDYASVDAPSDLDGRSLRPIIEGRASSVHEHVFSEFIDNGEEWKGWVRRMVSDGEWRLEAIVPNLDGDLDGVLYHLPSDPGELVNRWHDPVVASHRDRLLAVLQDFAAA